MSIDKNDNCKLFKNQQKICVNKQFYKDAPLLDLFEIVYSYNIPLNEPLIFHEIMVGLWEESSTWSSHLF